MAQNLCFFYDKVQDIDYNILYEDAAHSDENGAINE